MTRDVPVWQTLFQLINGSNAAGLYREAYLNRTQEQTADDLDNWAETEEEEDNQDLLNVMTPPEIE